MTYELHDTFNHKLISSHRTIAAAVAAKRKHLADVKARNGQNSYLTYDVTRKNEEPLTDIEREEYANLH